jgi:hypothetical protein
MMGEECSTYEKGAVHTGIWWKNLRERDHLENPSVNKRIILKWIFKELGWWHGLD